MSWFDKIASEQEQREFDLEKSFTPDLITFKEFSYFFNLGGYEIIDIEKSAKDTSKLIKKEVWITRNGKRFKQTVWVSPVTNEEQETPVGEELSPTVKGLQIEKYSEKSILIKGDTYANIDLMRQIKSEVGGVWNGKLKGWIFALTQLDKVLGLIWSDVKDKDEDKAQAIQNQKNESLSVGDELVVAGEKAVVEAGASDSEGTKYNVSLPDGTKLEGVDEKVIDVQPVKDDNKIAEIINNAIPENRVKTEKQLFGIKPVEDIHKYSLQDYMKMHGISDEDIQKAINRIKGRKEELKKRSSGGTGNKSEKGQTEGLTKNQLIGKLIAAHYNAVKKAVEAGEEISESALAYYDDLKQAYNEKRKAMSEETKRKISEALKKNKVEEKTPEQAAKEFLDSLSEDDLNNLKNSFKEAVSEIVKQEQEKLAKMVAEKDRLEKRKMEIFAEARAEKDYNKQSKIKEETYELAPALNKLDKLVRKQRNIVEVLSNGGDMMEITDATGVKHERVPDFSNINTTDIDYTIDNILSKEKPGYIPFIHESDFESGSFIFDIIKVGEDKYLLATNKYREKSEIRQGVVVKREGEYDPEDGGFIALNLDQLVLTQDYYVTKAKAVYKQKAEIRNQKERERWDSFSEDKKKYYYDQRNFYESMPVSAKKKVSKEEWLNLSIVEKENIYIPIKKHNPEKIKSRFDDSHMANSFHSMYERFVNPNAKRKDSAGRTLERGEMSRGQSYAHSEAWKSWNDFRETLNFKINDINIQREELSEMRSKAIETSYGESGTNSILVEKYGIKVKRQNGEEIKPNEIEQIKKAWVDVQETFGALKESAKNDNLKISHAGKKHMFASKAVGVYVPRLKTIGVTAKEGEDQLGFTMGHEVAHWIDNMVGNKYGKRHASDNYESTAGKIATMFRQNLNKKSDSKYINATHENFARCLEMHHAIEKNGENALIGEKTRYIDSPIYVSLNTYNQIKPLIKQFLEENKDILKSFAIDLFA